MIRSTEHFRSMVEANRILGLNGAPISLTNLDKSTDLQQFPDEAKDPKKNVLKPQEEEKTEKDIATD